MLLAINVGNSRISVGVFDDNGNIVSKFKIASDLKRTFDEYYSLISTILSNKRVDAGKIDAAIISSVVPQLTDTIKAVASEISESEPMIVGPGVKTGFLIKIDNPSELGGDIVANTAAMLDQKKKNGVGKCPSIVVDMNTVTTVSAINSNDEYIGCCIFPGIQMSFESMRDTTALLPNVNCSSVKNAIGKNSQDSVRSGVINGNAIMLDGFVYRFAKEMKCRPDEINLTITGEYAEYVLGLCNQPYEYDADLTMNGLYVIYRNNKNR